MASPGGIYIPRRSKTTLTLGLFLATIACYAIRSRPLQSGTRVLVDGKNNAIAKPLACGSLPGADETVVILKTGTTELETKLPIHIATTFQCYPHHLLFSDAARNFQGEEILDALDPVSPAIKNEHPDFELYRQIRDEDQNSSLWHEHHDVFDGKNRDFQSGHEENPAWKIDKWKFLPMARKTLEEFPAKKWYIFAEADTYILWASLLKHLATLDHTEPYYSGVALMIGNVPFAHGGSGFIVSRPALELVADYYTKHQQELEDFTDNHWAGDCVLGKTFTDSGAQLTDAWPIFQGDYPGMVPYLAPDGRPRPPSEVEIWCSPVVSYHHMEPAMIRDMWHFERERLLQAGGEAALRHGDIFNDYILPRITAPRLNWDNESELELGPAQTLKGCRDLCEASPECIQYSLNGTSGSCRAFALPRLGKAATGMESGWLNDRIKGLVDKMEHC